MPRPANSCHACLLSAGVLLCLFALGGCEQPAEHAGDTRQAPRAQPEPAIVSPAAASASAVIPGVPEESVEATVKALPRGLPVLTPDDSPFAKVPAHNFGEVPESDWLATQPRHPARDRLLPDLFEEPGKQDKVNFEGELLLDGTRGTSRMVDGVGVRIEITTDD